MTRVRSLRFKAPRRCSKEILLLLGVVFYCLCNAHCVPHNQDDASHLDSGFGAEAKETDVIPRDDLHVTGPCLLEREIDDYICIPAGNYTIGSPVNEPGHEEDEPLRQVNLVESVLVSKTEVSFGDYRSLMGIDDPTDASPEMPVASVTWNQALQYCNILSSIEGFEACYQDPSALFPTWVADCTGYRLLTENEWEIAARARCTGAFAGGDIEEQGCGPDPVLDEYGWYCYHELVMPSLRAQKEANSFGIFDMHGNVWEWTWDVYRDKLIDSSLDDEDEQEERAIRGGGWRSSATECRSANRNFEYPWIAREDIGFRVGRTLAPEVVVTDE